MATTINAEERLGAALIAAVSQKLDVGAGFVRIPEVVSPLPVADVLARLGDRGSVRAAVFTELPATPATLPVTTEVHVAIDWRNDAAVTDDLVVIGDLERDRAAGLAELPTFQADEVRRLIFDGAISDLRPFAAPEALERLLRALGGLRTLTDLRACAEYCEAICLHPTDVADTARLELWRLGLLPDTQTQDLNVGQLRRNWDLVIRIRSMDATGLQRLISHISDVGSRAYESLRRFASSGELKWLSGIEYTQVAAALRSARAAEDDTAADRPDEQLWREGRETIAQAVVSPDYSEEDFLRQLQEMDEAASADTRVTIGGENFEWERSPIGKVAGLLADETTDADYAGTAGSVETVPDELPSATPGSGTAEWDDLAAIANGLQTLERRRKTPPSCGPILTRIIDARGQLQPFLDSLQLEGVRLFIASPKLRAAAQSLVADWVELWRGLEDLKNDLPEADRNYVVQLAEDLSRTDLRIVRKGQDVTAYVLPLHPVILEPRVRAAGMFSRARYLPADFFDLVVGSLDPAMPSMTIRLRDSAVALGYAGTWNGLPYYARASQHVDGADVPRTLQQIIGRFINVHPYAELSLSLALVNPAPRTAKALLRWVGENDNIQRARIAVYADRQSPDEIREALDQATEELISGEVVAAADRFPFSVERLGRLSDLPKAVDQSEGPQHVMVLFGLAESDESSAGAMLTAPTVGSLVSEWDFSTHPLQGSRPVIRPRSGSDELTNLVGAQATLFGSSVPEQRRSPLLSAEAEAVMEELASRATWVVICEGISTLVPPQRVGTLDLLGRMVGPTHVAFAYSNQPALLLEPILRYLQRSTWMHPSTDALAQFLLGTVRQALPEGLLGFFKAQGNLSSASVLGRLGLAAVLAYLNEEGSDRRLLVSLDTEAARRWLGLRDGPELRADLLSIEFSDDGCLLEAIEIKARSEPVTWGQQPPDTVVHAVDQVTEMDRLLRQMFRIDEPGPFTPSRREILKRQVFLEALQQWESVRISNPIEYEERVAMLNRLFGDDLTVRTGRRVFIVSPRAAGTDVETTTVGEPPTPVTTLGVEWFRRAIDRRPESTVDVPADVLDEFGAFAIQGLEDVPDGERDREEPVPVDGGDEAKRALAAEPESAQQATKAGAVPEEALAMATRLRDAFVARHAPFRAIDEQQSVMGPAIIQIPFSVPAGVRLSALEGQEEDVARDLGVESVRISNWRGHPGYAVAELPRAERQFPDVSTLERPQDLVYPEVAIGAQLDFAPLWVALDALPHLLVGGTTGSGKSVFLRSLLWQLTNLYSASELDLVLIDAKGMADYLDFLKAPQFKDPTDFHSGIAGAIDLLENIVNVRLPERTARFREFARESLESDPPRHVTNLRELLLEATRQGIEPPLSPLVVVIDEFAELVLGGSDRRRFETLVTRFNQVARAVGGHLIAATQRPSTDVVTGLIKSNFARVALKVQQRNDSRVILDENGAEALLGRGDLLFRSPDGNTERLQGYSAIGPYRFM